MTSRTLAKRLVALAKRTKTLAKSLVGEITRWRNHSLAISPQFNPRLPDITILDMIFVYIFISRYFHFIVYSLI